MSAGLAAGELAAALEGDAQALASFLGRYHDRVYRFGLGVCRNPPDAEDVVQEAFATLARRPDVVRSGGALGWLYTVVRNGCLELVRRVRGARPVPLSEDSALDVADQSPTPEAALERVRLVARVHQAIAALDAEAREVLLLRDVEGLSGEETAAALGLTVPAMKSRLHRARTAVRALVLEHAH